MVKNNLNAHFYPFNWLRRLEQFFLFLLLFNLADIVRGNHLQKPSIKDTFNDIFNHTLAVADDINISILYDTSAMAYYQKFPDTYPIDITQLHTTMSKMAKDPRVHCKMTLVSKHPDFKIKLFTHTGYKKSLGVKGNEYFFRGGYDGKTRILSLMIEVIQANLPEFQTIMYHEWEHTFLSVRNEYNGIHRLSKKSNSPSDMTPCGITGPSELVNIFKKAYNHQLDYILMLDLVKNANNQNDTISPNSWLIADQNYISKGNTYLSKGSFPESTETVVKNLKHLTIEYEPQVIGIYRTFKQADDLRKNGILNEHYQLSSDFHLTEYGIKLHVSQVTIIPTVGIMLYSSTVKSITPENRVIAALLDGYYFMQTTFLVHNRPDSLPPCEQFLKEADAYMHQVYEAYPELFNYLFAELVSYHNKINAPLLRECLSNLVLEKKISFIEPQRNSELNDRLAQNLAALKKAPYDSITLYHAYDAYRQLSIQQKTDKDWLSAQDTFAQTLRVLSEYVINRKSNLCASGMYAQTVEEYLLMLMSQNKYGEAQTVLNQALALFPNDCSLPIEFSWKMNYYNGNILLHFEQYIEAENFFKKSIRELHEVFDENAPNFNAESVASIKKYNQHRVKDLYRDLENVQTKREKFHSAKRTRKDGIAFLRELQSSTHDNAMIPEGQNSARLEL